MNTKLLRKIQREILKEPRRMDMTMWGKIIPKKQIAGSKHNPPCGTVGCIAGWAVMLAGSDIQIKRATGLTKEQMKTIEFEEKFDYAGTENAATKLLEITSDQADRLFFAEHWPKQFLKRPARYGSFDDYYRPRPKYRAGTEKYAQNVVARIEHFIKTKGME